MHEQQIDLVNKDKCLPSFFPVCRNLIENIIQNDQHTDCSELLSQFQNVIAEQSVACINITLFGKGI